MCSLNQESPGADAERSTSLPKEGECYTGQALLFLPAPPLVHGEGAGAFDMAFATDEVKTETRISLFL